MPQNIDSNYDALVECYADTELERMTNCDMLRQFAYETLVDRFENMTEKELIEHVAEMGDYLTLNIADGSVFVILSMEGIPISSSPFCAEKVK